MQIKKQCDDTEVNPLYQFADDIINGVGGLRDYEYYEMAAENFEHDICVVIWTLKSLANPKSKMSKRVLELVNERFSKQQEENG